MRAWFVIVRRLLQEDRGATAIEYALMASLIAIAALSGVGLFGNAVYALYQTIINELAAALP
ncbi:Flp family type IVb pilin [Trinickia fusca]|uniref:Flp family type IVb pilin n=1 Tax=Trinickia fusca TaxID=2419777 RepID=A0A494WZC0_9BURK|nr:Flp family type IVb pilin [Trinickia fusca]RKP43817.1 Flp family type IVb pilin [Trinickia fusca]